MGHPLDGTRPVIPPVRLDEVETALRVTHVAERPGNVHWALANSFSAASNKRTDGWWAAKARIAGFEVTSPPPGLFLRSRSHAPTGASRRTHQRAYRAEDGRGAPHDKKDAVSKIGHSDVSDSAWSMSSQRSSTCSMPTEKRTKPSVMPTASRVSLGTEAWVMLAGMRDQTFHTAEALRLREKMQFDA
jgi:hypothetical protein